MFQSPRSGKFESNKGKKGKKAEAEAETFQSPRSGKFESNSKGPEQLVDLKKDRSFNPLDRGNLNQIVKNFSKT